MKKEKKHNMCLLWTPEAGAPEAGRSAYGEDETNNHNRRINHSVGVTDGRGNYKMVGCHSSYMETRWRGPKSFRHRHFDE